MLFTKKNMTNKTKNKLGSVQGFCLIENTLEFPVGDYLCRLWINTTEIAFEPNAEIVLDIQNFGKGHSLTELFTHIGRIPHMNAAQLKSKGFPEHGIVVYYVDF
jgi:hypothetical protein